ncbi:hypothetical protein HHK36_006723 [Tetracentron sinense]|uniref:RING-type E3 ubiquitin transferase n=1 Tax=Tetracentron sinense TaxID=13715 RepID=A0A834ZHZ2_TETSI|nr:hypothetical protein HHK36_006723 [Tetracentron sinense]
MAEGSTTTVTVSESSVPLLRPRHATTDLTGRPATLALLLGRASGRRGPSMLVRETAALQLEERRADWGYSKPVVALDIAWNLAFIVVAIVMLSCTSREKPNTPIRVWICGYALQCLVHVILVFLEYRRRNRRRIRNSDDEIRVADSDVNDSEDGDVDAGGNRIECRSSSYSKWFMFPQPVPDLSGDGCISTIKRCETVNTVVSFLWWIVGFYWVVSGGENLLLNAPRLYWYTLNQAFF